MKQIFFGISILILLFALVFWLIPPQGSQGDKFQVAVLLPGSVEFFAVQKKGLNRAAHKFGLNLIYADAEWDSAKQLAQLENFIARKVDLVLICSVDNLAMQRAVPLAEQANIPLMTFSNTIGHDPHGIYPGVISHIGRDEVKNGIVLGEMIEAMFPNSSVKILLIQGAPGSSGQRMREAGFMKILKLHSRWEIVSKQYVVGWTKEGALNAVEDFLQTGKKVDVIANQWWAASIASAQALKESGVRGVKVIGLEFSKELIPYIEKGEVNRSTYFSIIEEGFKAVETAALFLKNREIPKFVEIVPIEVRMDNVREFQPEL